MTNRKAPRARRPKDSIPEPVSAQRLNSRAKGAVAERELAELLREAGYPGAMRGQQRAGTEAADVVGGPQSVHFECKAVENPSVLHSAIRQAERDALDQARKDKLSTPRLPVVAWKRRRAGWVAALDLGAFLALVREVEQSRAESARWRIAAHARVPVAGHALSTIPQAEAARRAVDAVVDPLPAAVHTILSTL